MALAQLNTRWILLSIPAAMLGSWLLVLLGGNGHLDSLGNPLGADFAMFHLAGQTASQGNWDQLYNEAAQQQKLVNNYPGLPADTYLPYRYPPITAIVLAPLGALPSTLAWLIFTGIGLAAWAFCWSRLLANCTARLEKVGSLATPVSRSHRYQAVEYPNHHVHRLATVDAHLSKLHCPTNQLPFKDQLLKAAVWSLLFSPIFAQCLIDGQASLFWFAIAAGTYLNLQAGRFALAGAILALAALKPNVMALLAVVWIVRYPRLLLGLIPAGLLMTAAMVGIAGLECIQAYIQLAQQLATGSWAVETPYWKVQSLLSWSQLLWGDAARSINLGVGFTLAVALGWVTRPAGVPSRDSSEIQSVKNVWALCGGLVINALFNPYTPVYDLTLLGLGMFAALAHAAQFGHFQTLAQRRDVQLGWLCLWLGPILSQSLSSALACPQQVMPLWLIVISIGAMLACPVFGVARYAVNLVQAKTKRELPSK